MAGPAALVIAKLVKLRERLDGTRPSRVLAKDASDLLRLLRSCDAAGLGRRLASLSERDAIALVAEPALAWLVEQLKSPRSQLVELTVVALNGAEPESQVRDSLATLGGRLLKGYDAHE